jgi:hypothetical protein
LEKQLERVAFFVGIIAVSNIRHLLTSGALPFGGDKGGEQSKPNHFSRISK